MSLVVDAIPAGLSATIERLVGAPVALEALSGGRNSRLFRVRREDGLRCLAKWYASPAAHGRDRLLAEFRALRFLAQQGIWQVPAPLAADAARRVGLYELIDGEPHTTHVVTEDDGDHELGGEA